MKQTSTTLILSEGKTLTYVIPIVFCAIAAIISFVLFWPLGVILAIICISLALVESGLEFNSGTMEYRRFKSVFGTTWGSWVKIKDPDSFHLRLSVESHSYRTYTMGTSPTYYGNGAATSKSITYDVQVLTKTDQWVDIYEFSSYKLALKLVKHLSEAGSIEVVDHVALKLEENHQKRMNRRR
jgi:hypothetical protein